ncbi:MAG: helix-turn-helix domain-containing protein [bacterium]
MPQVCGGEPPGRPLRAPAESARRRRRPMNQPTEFVESPGALLASARVRAGLSLVDVSERSRISVANLAALESDDWDALPAMVYTRGFMRLFAREVGLDPEAVIARLDTLLDLHNLAEERVHSQAETEEREAWWAAFRMRSVYTAALGALIVVFLVAMFGISPKTLEAAPTSVLDVIPAALQAASTEAAVAGDDPLGGGLPADEAVPTGADAPAEDAPAVEADAPAVP